MTRYEACIEKDWEAHGLASVLVARVRDDGSADFALFLVDLFCLGVKDTLFETDVLESELREFIDERLPEDFRERFHPACAKKLIEGALAYAQSLGFAPHSDFRKARKILSGIDASLCPRDFSYGRDGRPCYIRGYDDSEERVKRVHAILAARCGPDGYDYEDADEDGDDDTLAARNELLSFLHAEPDDVPRFYQFTGFLTAMVLSPEPRSPLEVYDFLWNDQPRVWESEADAAQFAGWLTTYWNYLTDLVHDAIASDAHPDAPILDIWEEDLRAENADEETESLAMLAASMEWAIGFESATRFWPEVWNPILARPDLAPHGEVIDWWAHLEEEENREKMAAAAESSTPRTLNSSVKALARALRLSRDL